ncbi:ABC transporter permease [Lutispora sp.]|uniref:ABC transporter permease n=1 Tax=Lutispora sp. TaxID=2828727 RepID=UPI002B213BDF|nr:ABC transporter permease [Lutispora sp.]MEA4961351.1 ABC transporter permease [Lutispora sp.]
MKRALFKFIHDNTIFMFFPAIGIIAALVLLTASFSIYRGGTENATACYKKDDKSILSAGLKDKDSLTLSKNVLNWEDGDKFKEKLNNVEELIFACEGSGSLSSDVKDIQIKAVGINHLYWNIENKKILYGRLINDEDVSSLKSVAVINEEASLDLFNTKNAVGNNVDINIGGNTRSLSVIGVLKDPYFYDQSVCYIPYDLFSSDSYDNNWISIVVPKAEKDDSGDKLSKILYDRYGSDIYEAREYKQLLFIEDWLKDNLNPACLLIIMCTLIGITTYAFGISNYLKTEKEKIYMLKTFGVSDDKIRIKLFNKLSLHGFLILLVSIALGYIAAFIIGSFVFIKPGFSIIHIFIILSYGYFCLALAILISVIRFKINDIF